MIAFCAQSKGCSVLIPTLASLLRDLSILKQWSSVSQQHWQHKIDLEQSLMITWMEHTYINISQPVWPVSGWPCRHRYKASCNAALRNIPTSQKNSLSGHNRIFLSAVNKPRDKLLIQPHSSGDVRKSSVSEHTARHVCSFRPWIHYSLEERLTPAGPGGIHCLMRTGQREAGKTTGLYIYSKEIIKVSLHKLFSIFNALIQEKKVFNSVYSVKVTSWEVSYE